MASVHVIPLKGSSPPRTPFRLLQGGGRASGSLYAYYILIATLLITQTVHRRAISTRLTFTETCQMLEMTGFLRILPEASLYMRPLGGTLSHSPGGTVTGQRTLHRGDTAQCTEDQRLSWSTCRTQQKSNGIGDFYSLYTSLSVL